MCLVNPAHDVGGLLRRDALQDAVGHFDDGDFQAAMAGNGRCLETDITAADDEDAATGAHLVSKQIGIALVASDIDAFEIAADCGREPARSRAGGERQRAVIENRAVLQQNLLAVRLDLLGPGRKAKIDIIVRIPVLGAEQQAVEDHFTEQVFFESGGR